jgi:hemerythrin superfamily protein
MPNNVEKVMSGLMGAAKDIKAGFKGLTGVFMHLMEEHGKVGALIKSVAKSDDEAVRAELYPKIRKDLLAHEKGELKVVYPALANLPGVSSIELTHAREASELEIALADVDALAFSDAAWGPTFQRLADLVERHVEHEENEFFPKAQQALGEERAKRLLPEFEAAKKQG